MSKFKRFIRNACGPIPLDWLFLLFAVLSLWLSVFCLFWTSTFSFPEALDMLYHGSFPPEVMLGIFVCFSVAASFFILPVIFFLCGLLCQLPDLIIKPRKGAAPARHDWLLLYVDAATYDRLHQMADENHVGMNDFCRMCLEAVDPTELPAAIVSNETDGEA